MTVQRRRLDSANVTAGELVAQAAALNVTDPPYTVRQEVELRRLLDRHGLRPLDWISARRKVREGRAGELARYSAADR